MSEPEHRAPAPDEVPPITYASPIKRVWAWVGVAYMLLILLLFTWFLAKAEFIHGIGGLMVLPALAGVGATAVVQYRTGRDKGPQQLLLCILTVCVTLAFIIWGLAAGIPALLENFGG